MQSSTVYPENYIVNRSEEGGENGNIHQNRAANSTPTRRCIRFCIPVTVVLLVVICAVAIPLAITSKRNKVTSQLTTIKTMENTTSIATMNITDSNTTKSITTASSLTSNYTVGIITIKEIMVSAVSSASDTRSMASVSAPTNSADSGTIGTASVDASTKMNSMSSGWGNSPISPITSIIDAENTKPTTFTAEPMATIEGTTSRPMIPLNHMNDTIIGLYNTTAGESTGGFNGTYSGPDEMPQFAMDGLLKTKYLNYGHKGGVKKTIDGPGIGTGFLVIPSINKATIACGLLFATADDNPQRDPITVTLEGSNESSIVALNRGSSWVLIYNGSTGIEYSNRTTYGTQQNFPNKQPFASYRLLITSQRDDGDAVQYSEARIMGYI